MLGAAEAALGGPSPPRPARLVPLCKQVHRLGSDPSVQQMRNDIHPPAAPTVETTGADRHIYKVCKATKSQGYTNISLSLGLGFTIPPPPVMTRCRTAERLNHVDVQKQQPPMGSQGLKTSHSSEAPETAASAEIPAVAFSSEP